MRSDTVLAKTFTPSYDALEDRIRLVINYEDYNSRLDLWITRSFLIKLLPVMDEYINKHDKSIKSDINENKTAAKIETNKTEMKNISSTTDKSTFEVTKKDPLLLKTVDISYKAEQNKFELIFKTDSVMAKTTVSGTHARIIFKTIFDAVPKVGWGISPALFK